MCFNDGMVKVSLFNNYWPLITFEFSSENSNRTYKKVDSRRVPGRTHLRTCVRGFLKTEKIKMRKTQ